MEILINKDEYPIILTDKAVEAVKKAIEEDKDLEGSALRVNVVGAGCAGFQNNLDFAKEPNENDFVMDFDGLKVFIDPVSTTQLEGTIIDYVTQGFQCGFKFNIPNSTSCACGSSFSV